MTRIANEERRVYQSQLRAQQAEETRGRILDAAIRVIARGVASLSIPAVAREARVSVPTVYRHFPTKDELLRAIYPHSVKRSGIEELTPPQTLDEVRDGVRAYFGRLDLVGDMARAAMASPAADEVRRLSIPRRLEMGRRIAQSVTPKLARPDVERVARVMTVLISSGALRMWRDGLGRSVEQAADDIDWVVRAAVAAAQGRKR